MNITHAWALIVLWSCAATALLTGAQRAWTPYIAVIITATIAIIFIADHLEE